MICRVKCVNLSLGHLPFKFKSPLFNMKYWFWQLLQWSLPTNKLKELKKFRETKTEVEVIFWDMHSVNFCLHRCDRFSLNLLAQKFYNIQNCMPI
ncbi:hypothetical protein M6B38_389835 [Iris pallida]|uniref:Uncharacterized protein n=1 Tax=Iris pallida TaxID=29817 RepID=A0AAX6G0X1_IRIPA|nr:hypothetical protein M6B38_389835 [Iris pallida]